MFAVLIAQFVLSAAGAASPQFFAMDTGTKDAQHVTPQAQIELVKKLGFDGFGSTGYKELPEFLKALDTQQLKLVTIYSNADIEPDKFSYEPGLKEALPLLKDRNVIIWLPISSKQYALSSADGDPQAIAMLREMADMAAPFGVRIALYPHTTLWLEKVEDAVRVANKVDRPNVGVTFNLCHWLNAGKGQNMTGLMQQAMPRLMVVTINGADKEGAGWDQFIQPLGQGNFDVNGFVQTLLKLGYSGPFGLQHYGIKGDAETNLQKSMAGWKKIVNSR